MIRVLHTADLHLGRVYSKSDSRFSRLRKKEQMALFASIMLYARSQKADILLFSGDLLDCGTPDNEIKDLLMREFENAENVEIFIAPGRNDTVRPGSFLHDAVFPANVHVYKSERVERIDVDRLNATVYGYGFCHKNLAQNPFAVMPPVDGSRFNLLCGCGSLDGAEQYCPIKKEEIAHSSLDYIALGGSHLPTDLLCEKNTYYAVSGSPEGLSFEETGYRSVRIVAMEKEAGKLLLKSKCVRLSARRFEKCRVEFENAEDCGKAQEAALEFIRTEGLDKDSFLMIELAGTVRLSFRAPKEAFAKAEEKVGYLQVADNTTMLYEPSQKEDFKTMFAAKIAEKIKEEGLRSDVLKCGFDALEK